MLVKIKTIAKLMASRMDRLRHRMLVISPFHSYHCNALAGNSNYNICINSDLSVSCNCQDYDGSGQIGSLKEGTLQEIMAGPRAQAFRDSLAEGKLPIPTCANCAELRHVSKKYAKAKSRETRVPTKGIMVENNVSCNLECLACDRGVVGTRKSVKGTPGGRIMSLDDIRFVAEVVKQNEIEHVCYHNLGEPFMSKRILAEMQIMRELNPSARFVVSTNGMFVNSPDKREAALLFDHIFFSIDGSSQESVQKYQVGMNFEQAYLGLKSLVALRDSRGKTAPKIEWKYVVFEWNDSEAEVKHAIDLARESGADLISFVHGGMPNGVGMSRRYVSDPFFRSLGIESWQGRVVELR